jgi:hypothetical protein
MFKQKNKIQGPEVPDDNVSSNLTSRTPNWMIKLIHQETIWK